MSLEFIALKANFLPWEGKRGCERMIATAVASVTKQTILLVDDDDPVRDLAARILERAGYDVLNAVNGKEALKIYAKEHGTIALVILDLIMPEMGGKECLGELLKFDPEAKVIISTGASADDELKDAVKPYAKGLVNKPYEISQLLHAVQAALEED
jgi:two-component system cell cycle sensor histidine kinase/response regulator CckA